MNLVWWSWKEKKSAAVCSPCVFCSDYQPDPTYYRTTTMIVRPIATGVHVLERALFFVPVTMGG
jgi:hypothetical protein